MTLTDLHGLLRLNARPIERPTDEQISCAEAELGVLLPEDYKQFIKHYGRGSISAFIRLCSPGSNIDSANLMSVAKGDWDGYATLKQEFPDEFTYPRYPEARGLLPWADTINGDTVYWLTDGSPNAWPIVMFGRSCDRHHVFHCGMVEFVKRLVNGKIRGSPFPESINFSRGEYIAAS